MNSRRRYALPLCLAAAAFAAGASLWFTDPPPFSAEVATQALLVRYRSDFGPTTSPVRELESEPVVVTTVNGREEWVVGHWKVQPDTLRYEYTPTGSDLHFQTAGHFKLSWPARWVAVADKWVSVYWRLSGGR